MWSLATYLLGSGPKSHFYHDQAGGPYMGYYAVWDAPIGTPTGGYYQADGVYQRDFTNGKVLVNPYEGGAAITVSLSEPLRVLEYDGALSSPVTSVDLSPQHGVVLVLAPLTLTLEVSPSHVAPGAVVTYTITYRNTGTGPADDVSSTVISGDVPEGTTLVPGSVYLNGVQQQPDPLTVDGKISVDVGTVLRGEEGTVTYEVRLQS